MTSSTQNILQDNEIPRLLGWRGAVAITSCAAVTLSIAQLRLSTATIMVSICAIPLLLLAVERGNALLASAARFYEPERAKAPTLTVGTQAPTLTVRTKAPTLPVSPASRVSPGWGLAYSTLRFGHPESRAGSSSRATELMQ